VGYLLQAGDRARGLYAHQEAIGFYERALALLKEQGAYARAARTLMKLGLTYHLAFNFPRARQAYQEGFALWQRADAGLDAPLPPAPRPLRLLWFDPATLDPSLAGDDTSLVVIKQLFSGLAALNAELDVVPEVARTWEVLEGGQRYLFHLRDDVSWSDGVPLTAEDFSFAWRRALDPALASPMASYLFDIQGARDYHEGRAGVEQIGVRAPDAHTLLVELEAPTGYFPHLLPMLFPVPRHALEAHGPAWTELDRLVTNGPFRLEDWQPGESMRLVRDPLYRGTFPGNLEQVALTLNLMAPAEQLASYAADRLDVVFLWSLPDAERVLQRYAGEYLTGPSLHTQYLGFNLRQPPFDDPRVRRALAMAVDRERLAGRVARGYVFPAGGFLPPEMPGHSPGIGLPYDPDEARRLLAEAGYPGGRGFPKLWGLANHPNKELVGEDVQAQWREILGIEVGWRAAAWKKMLYRLEYRPPPLFWMGWRADYPDPDNMLRLGMYRNWAGWEDATYTRLVEQSRRVTDPAQRLALYQQADRLLVEAAAIVPMLYGRQHLLVKPWVRKFSASYMTWVLWKDVVMEAHG
jgi:ABC-type oligopeptide transport system substrate-binding subunit